MNNGFKSFLKKIPIHTPFLPFSYYLSKMFIKYLTKPCKRTKIKMLLPERISSHYERHKLSHGHLKKLKSNFPLC